MLSFVVPPTSTTVPILPQILPKVTNGTSNSIVIQILPGTSNAAVPITENSISNVKIENVYSMSKTVSGASNDCVQKKIKKNLRKLIPKITIEN